MAVANRWSGLLLAWRNAAVEGLGDDGDRLVEELEKRLAHVPADTTPETVNELVRRACRERRVPVAVRRSLDRLTVTHFPDGEGTEASDELGGWFEASAWNDDDALAEGLLDAATWDVQALMVKVVTGADDGFAEDPQVARIAEGARRLRHLEETLDRLRREAAEECFRQAAGFWG